MIWRNIGYDAQELICQCDSNASVEKLAEMAEAIQSRLNDMALRGMQLENSSEHMPVIEEAYNSEDIDEDFDETEDEGMQMGGM